MADLALSEGQVRRFHGLEPEECRRAGLLVVEALVAPTARSVAARPVRFVLAEPRRLEGFELRHLAGVAEARRLLGASAGDWQVVGHAAVTSPDAVWRRGLQTWAVEFDAGSYSLRTVREKARHFRAAYDGQVWAVASERRQRTLGAVLPDVPLVVRPV